MDKFLTHTGLQPVYLGDINFIDKTVRDAFAKTFKAMTRGEDSAILWGCERTSSTSSGKIRLQWTAGIVMLGGEIFSVDAGSTNGTAQSGFNFIIETSYDESGRRQMKTGEEVDCYEIRKATIVGYTFLPEEHWPLEDVKTLDNINANFITSICDKVLAEHNSSNDWVKINARLFKSGSSYYVSGVFKIIKGEAGRELAAFSTDTLSSDDYSSLLGAAINPAITILPVSTYNQDTDELNANSLIMTMEDSGTPSVIRIGIRNTSGKYFTTNTVGNFFTRLNTL